MLLVFSSTIAALDCALAIRDLVGLSNRRVPDDDKMLLRIGVNVGDVIVRGGDVFGEVVNVASRRSRSPAAFGAAQPLFRFARSSQDLCARPSLTRSNHRGTDPYARWCGRDGPARHPPIPINDPKQALPMSGSRFLAPLIAEKRRRIAGDSRIVPLSAFERHGVDVAVNRRRKVTPDRRAKSARRNTPQ